MLYADPRITLIARQPTKPDFDWNHSRARVQRVAFLDSVNALSFALGAAMNDVGLDVERIIVDRAGDAEEFLHLLSGVPSEFTGDMLFIRDDGAGFLSATGRGGEACVNCSDEAGKTREEAHQGTSQEGRKRQRQGETRRF